MDLRIVDREREQAIDQLGRHVGDGRLDLAEFTERSGRVTAARTRAELAAVLADLPRLPDPARAARGRRIALTAAWGPWLLTGLICLVVWTAVALGGGGLHSWPLWVLGPWGALLVLGTVVAPAMPVPPSWDGPRPERVCRMHGPT